MRSVLSAFVATTFVTAQKGCSDNLGTNKCKNMTEKCSNWYFSNYMCPVSCGKCEKGIYTVPSHNKHIFVTPKKVCLL